MWCGGVGIGLESFFIWISLGCGPVVDKVFASMPLSLSMHAVMYVMY